MSSPDTTRSTSLGAAIQSVLLWTRDFGLSTLSVALLLGVATAGWTGSFIGLHDYAMAHMQFTPDEAWLVPLAFDGAAFGLSISSARAAMYGRSAIGSRILVVGFTGLSSWINWLHINDPQGRFVAALLPPAAVVLFEAVLAEMRAASERRSGRVRPRLHPLRWVVDPPGTWNIYRSWILDIPLPQVLADSVESARLRDSTESASPHPQPADAEPPATRPSTGRPDRTRANTTDQTTTTGRTGAKTGQDQTAGRGILAHISGLGRKILRRERPDPTPAPVPDPTTRSGDTPEQQADPIRLDPTRPDPTDPDGLPRPDSTRPTDPFGITQIAPGRRPDREDQGSGIGTEPSTDESAHPPAANPSRLDSTLAPPDDPDVPDGPDQEGHGQGKGRDTSAATLSAQANDGQEQPTLRPGEARQQRDSAEQHPWLDIASRSGLDRAMLQIALDADAAARQKRKKPAGRDKILDALKAKGYAIGATGAQNYQNAIADGRSIQNSAEITSSADVGERIDEYV